MVCESHTGVLHVDCRLIRFAASNAMGRDPADRTAPDAFPTATVREASAPPKTSAPSNLPAAEAAAEADPQRYILPKNLRNAVKHLSDGELDLMHAAAVEEMRRRGRTPSVETDLPIRPDMAKMPSPPTEKRMARQNCGHPFDSWSSECPSRSVQGGHHAITDCAAVRDFPIECAESTCFR
jgi:hypothetical protein